VPLSTHTRQRTSLWGVRVRLVGHRRLFPAQTSAKNEKRACILEWMLDKVPLNVEKKWAQPSMEPSING
jgi:hypothetical protein